MPRSPLLLLAVVSLLTSGCSHRGSEVRPAASSRPRPSLLDLEGALHPEGQDRRGERTRILRGLALVGGTMALLDRPVRAATQPHGHGLATRLSEHLADAGNTFALPLGLPTALLLAGDAGRDPEVRQIGHEALSAALLTGAVTYGLKAVTGRARPDAGLGPRHFAPFGDGRSFPSGHAAYASSLAGVLGAHPELPRWVRRTGQGYAVLMALSRVQLDRHHLSDAVAGYLLGGALGRGVARNHRARREGWAVAPLLSSEATGLTLSRRF